MWKTETWGERQSHLLVQVSVHGYELMFGKHELGALGCQRWKQGPDSSWTRALHYRYTEYGNKNKVPGLSKLFLVSLHEKHNFQGFNSHLNSKTDILVFQRLRKKILSLLCILECISRAGCISFGAAELHQFAQGRELLFPNRPWGELWPANQARISLALFQHANTSFSLGNIKIEWSSEEAFSTYFGYGSSERLSWLSSSF